jgi:hypothetical protein
MDLVASHVKVLGIGFLEVLDYWERVATGKLVFSENTFIRDNCEEPCLERFHDPLRQHLLRLLLLPI